MGLWGALLWVGLALALGPNAPMLHAAEAAPTSARSLIMVIGAGGTPQYEISFFQWAERWIAAARQAGMTVTVIGRHRGGTDREISDYQRLHEAIQQSEADTTNELWIVLIGHGTFDRRVAKFNLHGPDVSANELAEWLKTVQRPTAIINCSSASGPFISVLAASHRIVISATKSGTEINFSRFGEYLSQAINDPLADLDKDQQTSLWEAFLVASRRTVEFYESEGRIVSEHALLEDSGDRQGARADQFKGMAPITKPANGLPPDGRRAHQWHLIQNAAEIVLDPVVRSKRNEMELAIEQLRDHKDAMSADEYWQNLERLVVPLAELNEQAGL